MKEFIHLLLTRFNYKDKELLKERTKLFEETTLKSVEKQSSKNFIWIIFSDEDLNIDYSGEIKYFSKEKYLNWKKELSKDYQYIIESRLDNDDILHPNFIESLQTNFYKRNYVLDFKGYRYDKRINQMYEDLYYNERKNSPFVSLIHESSKEEYIFNYIHSDIYLAYPVLFLDQRMWIQVIHDDNKYMNHDNSQVLSMRGRKCTSPWWFK